MAHAVADLLITPINDSLIDFDLLAKIDPKTKGIWIINWETKDSINGNNTHVHPLKSIT